MPGRDKSLRYQPHAAVMQQVAGKAGLSRQIPVARATQIAATVMAGKPAASWPSGTAGPCPGGLDATARQGRALPGHP